MAIRHGGKIAKFRNFETIDDQLRDLAERFIGEARALDDTITSADVTFGEGGRWDCVAAIRFHRDPASKEALN